MAKAAGFESVMSVSKEEEVAGLRSAVYEGKGPFFAQVKIDPEKLPLVLPPREGSYLKNRFRISVLGPDAVYE
jgi:hypothetical protein